MPPLVLPKLPARFYFRFGEAINLEGLDIQDRDACQEAYDKIKVRLALRLALHLQFMFVIKMGDLGTLVSWFLPSGLKVEEDTIYR